MPNVSLINGHIDEPNKERTEPRITEIRSVIKMSNIEKMAALLKQELQTYKIKNEKYGNSFDLSVKKYGLISALTRMSDKWNRIENLILTHDNGTDDESLKDSLMDLANYCNMTALILERDEH